MTVSVYGIPSRRVAKRNFLLKKTKVQNSFSKEAETFISNASYPIPFYIDVSLDPFVPSKMQIEIQIQLFPSKLGVVKRSGKG